MKEWQRKYKGPKWPQLKKHQGAERKCQANKLGQMWR